MKPLAATFAASMRLTGIPPTSASVFDIEPEQSIINIMSISSHGVPGPAPIAAAQPGTTVPDPPKTNNTNSITNTDFFFIFFTSIICHLLFTDVRKCH